MRNSQRRKSLTPEEVRADTKKKGKDLPEFRRLVLNHEGSVECLACSNDGTLVASSYSNGDVSIWSPQTELSHNYSRHTGKCVCVDFSPDSKSIVSCGADGTIVKWSSRADTEVKEFKGHEQTVWQVLYYDEQRFASCSADKTVRLWNAGTGACVCILTGHTAAVTNLCVHADGTLASASWDSTVILWDTVKKTQLQRLTGHDGNIKSTAFSEDRQLLASCGSDGTVRVWNPTDGTAYQTIYEHDSDVNKVILRKSTLMSFGADGGVWRMNTDTGKEYKKKTAHASAISDAAFSPDASVFATVSDDASLVLWNMSADDSICRLMSPDKSGFTRCTFSTDGTKLIAGTKSGHMLIWDLLPPKKKTAVRRNSRDELEDRDVKFDDDDDDGHRVEGSCVVS